MLILLYIWELVIYIQFLTELHTEGSDRIIFKGINLANSPFGMHVKATW